MKKKIIIALILALSISMVSCNDKKEASSKDNTNVSQEDSSKDNEDSEEDDNEKEGVVDTTVKISDEKMIEIYETAMPTIRALFESICPVELTEYYGDGPDPNQLTALEYIEYDNSTIGEAAFLVYYLAFDNEGSVSDIRGTIDLNYDVDKIATEGFKFEESVFYTLVEALIGPGHDYSKVNEQIEKYYQGEDVDNMVQFDDGYFGFSIDCQDDGLYFGYNYFNERSE